MIDTAVVTVGLSPAASALAALTLRPRRLVLLGTSASAGTDDSEASRVRHLVQEVGSSEVVEVRSCGPGHSLRETWQELDRALEDVAAPYLLDYTGGPKILTTCAVRRHAVDHGPPGHRLRSYVDDERGVLVTDWPREPAVKLATAGLTLERLARLHGFEVDGWVTDTRVPLNAAAARLAVNYRHAGEVDVLRGHLLDRAGFRLVGGREPDSWIGGWGSDRAGRTLELAVAAVALGLDLSPRLDEVACSWETRLLGTTSPFAEFDVVLRRGHRVVAIEVKRSARELTGPVAGLRWARARLVFGSATRTVLAHGGGEAAGELRQQCDWLDTDLIGSQAPRELDLSDDLGNLGTLLRTRLPHRNEGIEYRPRQARRLDPCWAPLGALAAGQVPPPDYDDLVVPISGTALGVLAALRGVPARRTHLLGPAEPVETLRARFPEVDATHVPTALEHVTTQLPAGEQGKVALAVAPSKKSVTSALVVAALEHGHDLVHTAVGGWVQSWLHGAWRAPVETPWIDVLGADYRIGGLRAFDRHDPDALRVYVAGAQAKGWQAHVRIDDDRSWMPPVVLTSATMCAGVLAPTLPDDKDERADERAQALAAGAYLANVVGDAATLLVVLPEKVLRGARAEWWQHLAERRRWTLRVRIGKRVCPLGDALARPRAVPATPGHRLREPRR